LINRRAPVRPSPHDFLSFSWAIVSASEARDRRGPTNAPR
jgi:hypothetical protein